MLMRVLAAASLCLLLAACETPLAEDGLPYARPRESMVMDTVALDMLRLGHAPAWYESRLDSPPTVISGYESPVEETVTVRTYDRQAIYNGRVHDTVIQRGTSESTRRVIR